MGTDARSEQPTADDGWRAEVAVALEETRRRTLALVEPLTEASMRRQVCSFLSPLLWDLGHIARFEEEWLVKALDDEAAGRASARRLGDTYDAAITPRERRGELSLPSAAGVRKSLREVRSRTMETLRRLEGTTTSLLQRDGFVYRMVIQHEAQHQETMLQALDIPGAAWELRDGARWPRGAPVEDHIAEVDDERRVDVPEGELLMGTDDRSRAYDNERPRHRRRVAAFEIECHPVTNRRWQAFIDDGGYVREELWSPPGKEWRSETRDCPHPQGWRAPHGAPPDSWTVERRGVVEPLAPLEPVQHVSYWEAQAFARWAGGRLPTEEEWERAAEPGKDAASGPPASFVPPGRVGPPLVGQNPGLASAWGVEDTHGCVYQWTASPFLGYPGFRAYPYRAYSEVFFGDTYRVLRGSSWVSHPMLRRNTYRNWDLPQRRQIFSGVRVAYGQT